MLFNPSMLTNHKVFLGLKQCVIEFGKNGIFLKILSGECEDYKTQGENNQTFEIRGSYLGFKAYISLKEINNIINEYKILYGEPKIVKI